MILDKVHEIISFKQNRWWEIYLSFNTQKNQAAIDFEKDFYKLLNNTVFGKATEYVRNRRKVDFI